MDQAKIGSFLKELRKEKGLTQEQLAENFNVAARTVSRWENGNNMPDLSILVELADFYDVDIRELIDGERKGENMTEELKGTLEKVADYTDTEKEKILKSLYGSIVGSTLVFLALWVIPVIIDILPGSSLSVKYSQLGEFMFIVPLFGLIAACTGVIRILQIKGNMSKNRLRKLRKTMLPVSIMFFVLSIAVIFMLVTIMI